MNEELISEMRYTIVALSFKYYSPSFILKIASTSLSPQINRVTMKVTGSLFRDLSIKLFKMIVQKTKPDAPINSVSLPL